MREKKSCFVLVFVMFFIQIFFFNNTVAESLKSEFKESSVLNFGDEKKIGLILIDSMKKIKNLERPPVLFNHEKHVLFSEKQDKDCTLCHTLVNKKLSYDFKKLVFQDLDLTSEEVMCLYHDNCISCHKKFISSEEVTGPVTCGGCHLARNVEFVSLKEDFEENFIFNKYLHFYHVKSNSNKCELCHHRYDKKIEKLVYIKGSEDPCSYCHKSQDVDSVKSLKKVSHEKCINCHRDKKIAKVNSGPILCIDCHRLKNNFNNKSPVDRLERGQPDKTLISFKYKNKPSEGEKTTDLDILRNGVLFDHKQHELYNDSCIVCHHSSFNACSECHQKFYFKDGKDNFINFVDIMHNVKYSNSCIGCHDSKKKDKKCAGCHNNVDKLKSFNNSVLCTSCHLSLDVLDCSFESYFKVLIDKFSIKKNDLESPIKYSDINEIPENVTISVLKNEYDSVLFPHRKVFLSLLNQIQNSNLANYFHKNKNTLCLGCHHGSSSFKKSPACSSCHTSGLTLSNSYKPKLLVAYHQQCMQCHDSMGLDKPKSRNCVACHKKKDAN